ncbi:hypothetical protein NON00_11245 [Roseomonas sp. GC11]|uniref:calcium-binding protein n=1 Tax=Roseomonas sp. GC11 TaxID=2950546 RepID=UPI00210C34DF|nr:calcium-binding protein [Roseomonas sp. GC11]MCQ4160504.1 hypothetical protein [Roseomonas sp. GC11]
MPNIAIVPEKIGTETLVNTYTANLQQGSQVTALSDGTFLVVWSSMNQPGDSLWGVYAQHYNANGTKIGGEFHVNTSTGDHQAGATVVAQPGGAFTILWTSSQNGTNDIMAQRFDANGAKFGGEFAIASSSALQEQGANVVALPDGSFVVSWQQAGLTGGAVQEMAQHFDANWNALGSAFTASKAFSPSGGSTYLSNGPGELIALQNGNVVSIWSEPHASNNYSDVWAEILTPSGSVVGSAFRVNTDERLEQGQPAAATLADGTFVVAYYSAAFGGVAFQHFDANGNKLGAETAVDNSPNGSVTPSITALADGGFIIAWQGGADGDGSAVSAQRFAADGTEMTDYFLLDTQATLWQSQPSIVQLTNGTLVASWTSEAYGNSTDIALQQFNVSQRLTGNASQDVLIGGGADDTLLGGGGNDRLYGNGGDDTLGGGDGNDWMEGGAGNDVLNGQAGADTMMGGAGNDTYSVDDAGDAVSEAGGSGIDIVKSSISYTLGEGVERLVLLSGGLTGTGNELANMLTGSSGNDTLRGLAGNDVLQGGAGNDVLVGGAATDTLTGGAGADLFLLAKGDGYDQITDFAVGQDKLQLSGFGTSFDSWAEVQAALRTSGSNTILDLGSGDKLLIKAVAISDLGADSFLFG